ncbi:MAG: hypothetical protein WC479_05830 [Candidatus Izemoplasmatales bacterium]
MIQTGTTNWTTALGVGIGSGTSTTTTTPIALKEFSVGAIGNSIVTLIAGTETICRVVVAANTTITKDLYDKWVDKGTTLTAYGNGSVDYITLTYTKL